LLAVELAVKLTETNAALTNLLAVVFFLISFFFVYRSFYGMRIGTERPAAKAHAHGD
jgi:K(+)-stimulated pyrophosphate-energized sodium pump